MVGVVTKKEEEFLSAYDAYADAIFRHCFFRLSDREKALDMMQETFMRAWDFIRGGRKVTSWKSFLYKIANNLIIDEYRRKKATSLDALLEQEGVSEGDFEALVDNDLERIIDALDGERLIGLFKDLPGRYREALTLCFVDGLSPKEMAVVLGETENTISVRVHRGLARLRALYDHGTP